MPNSLSAAILCVALCFCALIGSVFGQGVIQYTATSPVSQEEANNAALSGVAKQILAQVSSAESQSLQETGKGGTFLAQSNYAQEVHVETNVALEGARIEVLPREKKAFVARATLDMDALVERYRKQAEGLCHDLELIEKDLRMALADLNMAGAMQLRALQMEKRQSLEKLCLSWSAYGQPAAEFSLTLRQAANLSDSLDRLVENVVVSVTANSGVVAQGSSETTPVRVLASLDGRPVRYLAVCLYAAERTLACGTTRDDGISDLRLETAPLKAGSYEVQAGLCLEASGKCRAGQLRKTAGIYSLQVDAKDCRARFQCEVGGEGFPEACQEIQKKFSAAGFVAEAKAAALLDIRLRFVPRSSLQTAGRTTQLVEGELFAAAQRENAHSQQEWRFRGTGPDIATAAKNAIAKAKLGDIREIQQIICK